jgi:hypothetical protein
MMSDREPFLTNKGATKVTIADTLFDAANDIRGYIEDDMVPSDKLEDELMGIVAIMLLGFVDKKGISIFPMLPNSNSAITTGRMPTFSERRSRDAENTPMANGCQRMRDWYSSRVAGRCI